eukprot:1161107-Pelagomonas_calceolata.AAC.5
MFLRLGGSRGSSTQLVFTSARSCAFPGANDAETLIITKHTLFWVLPVKLEGRKDADTCDTCSYQTKFPCLPMVTHNVLRHDTPVQTNVSRALALAMRSKQHVLCHFCVKGPHLLELCF